MEFIMGLFGVLCGMGCFAAGVIFARSRRTAPTVQPPSEEETRLAREQQQAFLRLQNYTVDDAYGLGHG